jgi:hypothetical protein
MSENRFWANPGTEEEKPTLVRLTPAAVTLAVVPKADLDNVITALGRGEEVAGQLIPLGSLIDAQAGEDSPEVTLNFRPSPSKKAKASIPFADQANRDEFMEALVGALGPPWQRRSKPESRWGLGFWMWALIAVLGLTTWGIYTETAMIEAGREPVNWGKVKKLRLVADVAHWAEPKLGTKGVLALGGSLISLAVLAFIALMASPPMNVVVEKASGATAAAAPG